MKKNVMLLLTVVILAFSACEKDRVNGEGPVITEERAVSNFSGVTASGSLQVRITQGAGFKVQVKDHSNLLPYLETKLNGTVLEVGYRENTSIKNSQAEVLITMPVVESLRLEGSGEIETVGIFPSAPAIHFQVDGSGNIRFQNGTTPGFTSLIRGSGNIYAFGLAAAEAGTITEGSGDTEISVSTKLNAKITGSGNVYYKGSPLVSTAVTGSGKVEPR